MWALNVGHINTLDSFSDTFGLFSAMRYYMSCSVRYEEF